MAAKKISNILDKLTNPSVLIKIVNAISGTGIMLSVFIDPLSRNKFLTAINAITFLITSIINAFNDSEQINNIVSGAIL